MKKVYRNLTYVQAFGGQNNMLSSQERMTYFDKKSMELLSNNLKVINVCFISKSFDV